MKTTTNTAFLIDGTPEGLNVEALIEELERRFPDVRFTDDSGEFNRLVNGNGLTPAGEEMSDRIAAVIESLICDDDRLFG